MMPRMTSEVPSPGQTPCDVLTGLLSQALERQFGISDTRDFEPLVRESAKNRDSDYQSEVALSLARELKRPPRAIAEALAEGLDTGGMTLEPEISGSGFLNFTLAQEWIERTGASITRDLRTWLPVVPPERVVIDYSGPNIAKEMHVGHLRSTIIGDSIARLLRFLGHEVISQNHLGDWGTPVGMLIEYMFESGSNRTAALSDLNALYQSARARFDEDTTFVARARERVVALQTGDPETLKAWQMLSEVSTMHFNAIYRTLEVELGTEHAAPESSYAGEIPSVMDELEEKGLLAQHEDATCIFPSGFRNRADEPLPLILRKRDGAYTYGATDLTALRHRIRALRADRILYVVGAPQALHLEMVFESARSAGWITDGVEVRHVSFGSVLGADSKMLRSRRGESIRLATLLEDAIDQAAAFAKQEDPTAGDSGKLSHALGIGAIKYADLSSDRHRDYVYSPEKMLSLSGNTSVYLQYAHARIRSVLRRAEYSDCDIEALIIGSDVERTLALKIMEFPRVLAGFPISLLPHRLCSYLYELSVSFSSFYEACPILKADSPELRASRLCLAASVGQILKEGLSKLGIEALEEM